MCREKEVPLKKSTSRHILRYGISPNRYQRGEGKARTKSEGNLDVPRFRVSFNSVSFMNQSADDAIDRVDHLFTLEFEEDMRAVSDL